MKPVFGRAILVISLVFLFAAVLCPPGFADEPLNGTRDNGCRDNGSRDDTTLDNGSRDNGCRDNGSRDNDGPDYFDPAPDPADEPILYDAADELFPDDIQTV